MNGNSNSAIPNSGSINVKLNAEELQLIIGALDEKHNAYVNSGAEVLPDLQAVNRLYNRLIECRLEIFAKGYNRRGRQLGSAVFISDLAAELRIDVPKLHEWIKREVIKSGRGSLDESDRGQTGGSDRTSRFQAASYPVLMEVRARNRKNSVAVRS
jgi:hypothetical protein